MNPSAMLRVTTASFGKQCTPASPFRGSCRPASEALDRAEEAGYRQAMARMEELKRIAERDDMTDLGGLWQSRQL
jgi:hypothetical protein